MTIVARDIHRTFNGRINRNQRMADIDLKATVLNAIGHVAEFLSINFDGFPSKEKRSQRVAFKNDTEMMTIGSSLSDLLRCWHSDRVRAQLKIGATAAEAFLARTLSHKPVRPRSKRFQGHRIFT